VTKGSTGQSVVIEGYDAVADVRRVRDELAEEMKGMTPGEKVAFIEAEAAKFRHNYPLHKEEQKS
jgi:hypothetical protein